MKSIIRIIVLLLILESSVFAEIGTTTIFDTSYLYISVDDMGHSGISLGIEQRLYLTDELSLDLRMEAFDVTSSLSSKPIKPPKQIFSVMPGITFEEVFNTFLGISMKFGYMYSDIYYEYQGNLAISIEPIHHLGSGVHADIRLFTHLLGSRIGQEFFIGYKLLYASNPVYDWSMRPVQLFHGSYVGLNLVFDWRKD